MVMMKNPTFFEEDGLEAQVGDVQAEALKEEPNGGRDSFIPFGCA